MAFQILCHAPFKLSEGKAKGKVHSRTGHQGPEGEWMYISTLSLTSSLGGGVVNTTSRPLYLHGKTRYPFQRRLGGPQDRSGRVLQILLHHDSIPRPSSPYHLHNVTHSILNLFLSPLAHFSGQSHQQGRKSLSTLLSSFLLLLPFPSVNLV
jgi:hypothetical protein